MRPAESKSTVPGAMLSRHSSELRQQLTDNAAAGAKAVAHVSAALAAQVGRPLLASHRLSCPRRERC